MKLTIASIIISVGLIGGVVWLGSDSSVSNVDLTPANNVSIVEGKQVIQINAKGGYQPRVSTAKAGIPTVLRFNTSGTFDCSSFVRVPSLGVSKALPQTGSTDIDIGTRQVGTLQGMCGMGMYPFEVDFQG